jgi:hypothetical protein
MLYRPMSVVILAGLLAVSVACEEDEGPEAEQFEATLSGAAERPNPVTTSATGTATFTVREASVDFQITASGLTDAILGHIHGPATVDQPAGVLVTLFSQSASPVDLSSGVLSSGAFPTTAFSIRTGVTLDSVLFLMRNGLAYVNVHTVQNQSGEIRGQILRR